MKILQYIFYKLLKRFSDDSNPYFQTITAFNIYYSLILIVLFNLLQLILRSEFLQKLSSIIKDGGLLFLISIFGIQYLITYVFLGNKSLSYYEELFSDEKPFAKRYGETIIIISVFLFLFLLGVFH